MAHRHVSVGSICTGYGGLDMAVHRIFPASRTIWVTDNDPDASLVLAARFSCPNLGDITSVDWTTVPRPTVLAVSPPCQPFSLAGKRNGAEDPRHVWPHIERAIARLQPNVVVLEQVPGFVSLGLREAVLSLDALGYVGRWGVVAAAHAGAAHLRRRLWLIAELAAARPTRLSRRATAESPVPVPAMPTARALARRRNRRAPVPGTEAAAHSPGDGRNQGLPQAALLQRPGLVRTRGRRTPAPDATGQRHRHTRPQGDAGVSATTVPDRAAPADSRSRRGRVVDWGEYSAAIARWECVLGRPAPVPGDDNRRLTGPFVEHLMGLPEGWISAVPGISRAATLRLAGGGIVPQQAELALRLLLDLPSPSLPAPR